MNLYNNDTTKRKEFQEVNDSKRNLLPSYKDLEEILKRCIKPCYGITK